MNPDRVPGSAIASAGPLGGHQSVLNPAGPGATEITELAWLLFGGGTVIFLAVLALAAYALLADPRHRRWMSRVEFIVGAGVVFPVAVLTLLLVRSLVPTAHAERSEPTGLRIDVVGEQWWWRVRYRDGQGEPEFDTANEIRIPTGRPVEFALSSADVIHSFWVPNLAGKLDMIPGRVNRLRLSADKPGEYRGQCAEYCGGPHARMALYVIAVPPAEFDVWRAAQRQRASAPATPSTARGHTLFEARGCGVCHEIRGTRASGKLGPDLTHVGSRVSLGAGTLRNGADSLGAWIRSSQHLKPENLMPSFEMLSDEEVGAIAAYLESLR